MFPRRRFDWKLFVLLAPLALLAATLVIFFAAKMGGGATSEESFASQNRAVTTPESALTVHGKSQPSGDVPRSSFVTDRIIKAANERGRNHLGQVLPLAEFALAAEILDAWRLAPVGSEISFASPDGRKIAAQVTKSWFKDGKLNRVAQISAEGGGTFGMTWSETGLLVALIQMPAINMAYRIRQAQASEEAMVEEWLLSDVVCATPLGEAGPAPGSPVELGLPLPEGHDALNAASSSQAAIPVPVLQSRPGATAVIYIDFDGETVTDPFWAGGNEIVAPPARLNSTQIREVWDRVAKEFEVFDVNVTTSVEDYNAAPPNRRTQCVVSNVADQVRPGAGGVAYLNSFSGTPSPICWAFIDTNPKYCADVVAHEVGHTLDLRHDGRAAIDGAPREEYYRGHGTGVTGWAPIMGVGYYKNLVQWSKGEYARANNPEDDLAIMSDASKIPFIADDLPDVPDGSEAVILPGAPPVAGLVSDADDTDIFRADLSEGSYRLSIQPELHANLDAKIEVLDAGLNVLVIGNPLELLTADARFRTDVPGTFYFRVSGTGKPEVAGTGYSAYSSFGSYGLTLTSVYGDLLETVTGPSADDFVQSLATDEDGRIYIAGNFAQVDGVARAKVARLTPHGRLDETFDPGTGPNGLVRVAFYAPRDKGLYIGGDFGSVGGAAHVALARLAVGKAGLTDGSPDPGFTADFAAGDASTPPYIQALVLQDDGKILVGGFFSSVNGQPRENLARIHPDGTLDENFDAPVGGPVHAIAVQVDGKIYVGGSFGEVHGAERNRLARLHRNGALDANFDVGSGPTGGFDGTVMALAATLDQEVYVGGSFSRYNGRGFYNNLVKLQTDGKISPKFNYKPGLNGAVRRVFVRPDGQILVSGQFTRIANDVLGIAAEPVGRIVQLLEDGNLDPRFNPGATGANGTVLDAVPMASGNLLVAGAFTAFNDTAANRLAVVSGFDTTLPIITSPLSRNIDAGGELDHLFTSSVTGAADYELLDSQGNPATLPPGLSFDGATGRLSGIPLQAGTFEFLVRVVPAAPGSAASESTRFMLVVNASPVSFARWQQAFSPAVTVGDSPDLVRGSSGLSDFMVYALSGGNPATAGPTLCPVVQTEEIEGVWHLTLTASKYQGASDSAGNPLVYRVEFSDELHDWKSGGESVTVISETASQIKARATAPVSTSGRQFLRLKVLANNPL
jgi:uncharacterized delta-60 repeat protein